MQEGLSQNDEHTMQSIRRDAIYGVRGRHECRPYGELNSGGSF